MSVEETLNGLDEIMSENPSAITDDKSGGKIDQNDGEYEKGSDVELLKALEKEISKDDMTENVDEPEVLTQDITLKVDTKVDEDPIIKKSVIQQTDITSSFQPSTQKKFLDLISGLENQIDELNLIAEYYKKQRKEKEEKEIMEVCENTKKNLKLVESARSFTGTLPPEFVKEEIIFSMENKNPDLSLHEIEIKVWNAIDIRPPSISETTLSLYVDILFPYSKGKSLCVSTPVVPDSLSPNFNFSTKFRIERGKNIEKSFAKSKVSFSVFKKGWFFFTNKNLGKAELRLQGLLEKAEIKECLKVLSTNNEEIGELVVSGRLKTPISKDKCLKNITLVTINKLFLGEEDITNSLKPMRTEILQSTSNTQRPTSSAQRPTSSTQRPTSSAQRPASNTQRSSSGPSTSNKQNEAPKTVCDDNTFDPILNANINSIHSNSVLEDMEEEIEKRSKSAKDETERKLLSLQKKKVESRIRFLIIQVQKGDLTPESYADLLKLEMAKEAREYKRLSSEGKKNEASAAQKRMNLVKKELEMSK